ncbi:hypothetical protein [Wandonia haliotis]
MFRKSGNQNKKEYLPAFTVMEITIAIVVTSIVIAMVYNSITFFNRQMQHEVTVKARITTWYTERARLFEDFFLATDHQITEEDIVSLTFSDQSVIDYHVGDGILIRESAGREIPFMTGCTGMEVVDDKKGKIITFHFQIEQEPLSLYFPVKQTPAEKMNEWFQEYTTDGTIN